MTAINCLLQPKAEAAYLFSDGATYDRNGTVVGISSKAYVSAAASMALLASGRALTASFVAAELFARTSSFDDLRATIEGRLPSLVEMSSVLFGDDESEIVEKLGVVGGQGVELFFAGWSEKARGPAAFAISTAPRNGIAPFIARDAVAGWMTPVIDDDAWRILFGGDGVPDDINNFAMSIVEMQRQIPTPEGGYNVGGLVELVTIRRDHVDCRILKRWPEDRIGEPIRPRPVDWPQWRRRHPVWRARESSVVPMSRQQRRALARQQGR